MKEDPPLDARCRDKFLVQSVAIDADQVTADTNIVSLSIVDLAWLTLRSGPILTRSQRIASKRRKSESASYLNGTLLLPPMEQ